jgi:hypothetical protein
MPTLLLEEASSPPAATEARSYQASPRVLVVIFPLSDALQVAPADA